MTITVNTQTTQGQLGRDAQTNHALGSTLPASHFSFDTQTEIAGGDTNFHIGPFPENTPQRDADVEPTSAGAASSDAIPSGATPSLLDPVLSLAAATLDDIEGLRKATDNRYRILTTEEPDDDGEVRGFGLNEKNIDVARTAELAKAIKGLEGAAVKNLEKLMRKHPLAGFIKTHRGVGDKQLARLLAKIGDPYINTATGQPRTVSQLWAYSGLHVLPASHNISDTQGPLAGGDSTSTGGDTGPWRDDTQITSAGVAARRRKGQQANWNTQAKTKAWRVIESCMKQLDKTCKTDTGIGDHVEGCGCSIYRVAIDSRRKHTAVTHPDWTPGHSLKDGMRIASKELLKDLWRASRDIHSEGN